MTDSSKNNERELRTIKVRHILNASDEHVPDIQEGQILGFESLKEKTLENGAYYYIKYNGKKLIRKIYVTDTGLMLVRVNPKYSSEFYEYTDDKEKQLTVMKKLNLHPEFSKKDEK